VSQNQTKKNGLIIIISGPSGSGKTTLLSRLFESAELRRKLIRSISLTTRPRRSGEKSGRDYFFISQKRFLEQRKAKKILEWTRYLGYYYATPRFFIKQELKKGKNIALCLDFKGALKLKRFFPRKTILIFIRPPSIKALWRRITQRCQQTKPDEIQQRIRMARQEVGMSGVYDYRLVNKNLDETAQKLKNIILKEIAS